VEITGTQSWIRFEKQAHFYSSKRIEIYGLFSPLDVAGRTITQASFHVNNFLIRNGYYYKVLMFFVLNLNRKRLTTDSGERNKVYFTYSIIYEKNSYE